MGDGSRLYRVRLRLGVTPGGCWRCLTGFELAEYFAQVGIPLDNECRLVEMECELADDLDIDHELGAILVIPTRIVSAELITEDFYRLERSFQALSRS